MAFKETMDQLPAETLLYIVELCSPDTYKLLFVSRWVSQVAVMSAREIDSEAIMVALITNCDKLSLSRFRIGPIQSYTWLNKALRIASRMGLIDMVRTLVMKGAYNIQLALHEASCGGQLKMLTYLCEQYPEEAAIHIKTGAIKSALEGGSRECIQYVMRLCASNWDRAEYNAYKNGRLDIIHMVICHQNRVDYDAVHDEFVAHAIMGSFAGGHISAGLKMLMNHRDPYWNEVLIGCSVNGNLCNATIAIEHGADDFEAALYMAAIHDQKDMIQFIESYVQDTGIETRRWKLDQALSIACVNHHDMICDSLILLGAMYCENCDSRFHSFEVV